TFINIERVTVANADCVDEGVGFLRACDGVVDLHAAAGVVAVGEQDDGAARVLSRSADQLFRGGPNSVPDGGGSRDALVRTGDWWRAVHYHAAADVPRRRNKLDPIDRSAQSFNVARETLFQRRFSGERDNCCFVFRGAQHVLQKRTRSFFLVRQRSFFRRARVDQNCERQRQIDVLLKSEDLLRLSVFEYANVLRFQVADESFVFVSRGKKDVREIGVKLDDFIGVLRQF